MREAWRNLGDTAPRIPVTESRRPFRKRESCGGDMIGLLARQQQRAQNAGIRMFPRRGEQRAQRIRSQDHVAVDEQHGVRAALEGVPDAGVAAP